MHSNRPLSSDTDGVRVRDRSYHLVLVRHWVKDSSSSSSSSSSSISSSRQYCTIALWLPAATPLDNNCHYDCHYDCQKDAYHSQRA